MSCSDNCYDFMGNSSTVSRIHQFVYCTVLTDGYICILSNLNSSRAFIFVMLCHTLVDFETEFDL